MSKIISDRLAGIFRIAHCNLAEMAQDFICIQKI